MQPLDYESLKANGQRYRFATFLAISAFAVGLAIDFNNGEYFIGSLLLITAALILTALGMMSTEVASRKTLERTLHITVALQFITLLIHVPSADLTITSRWQLAPFYACICGAALAVIKSCTSPFHSHPRYFQGSVRGLRGRSTLTVESGASEGAPLSTSNSLAARNPLPSPPPGMPGEGTKSNQRWDKFWFPLVLSLHLLASLWIIHLSSNPKIDVWVFQQDGARELLAGRNPYEMTFPDIYHSTAPGGNPVYGPGLVVNDRVQFGFPYPPVSLLLSTAGYWAGGDHRYAQAFAMLLAGVFAGYCVPGKIPKLAAVLLLFTPREFFVLGRGWTEPFTVMLLAATLFFAVRRSWFLPVALGLFLVTKQYLILAVPLTFCLLPKGWRWRDWLSLLIQSAIVGAIATLPLATKNFHAYWRSTVTVQELAPFRWDALSYLVWYGFRGHLVTDPSTAVIWASLAAIVTLLIARWATHRTAAGFAGALAFVALGFFAFNKQAFANYYFFVIGAMCCAVAATQRIEWIDQTRCELSKRV